MSNKKRIARPTSAAGAKKRPLRRHRRLAAFQRMPVFGEPPSAQLREHLIEEDARRERMLTAVPKGRTGHVVRIDDFAVFVDTANYASEIVETLDRGGYEGGERGLVKELLRPDDRVIDVGTAIGIVAMTAAAIVGPENIRTFEGNPDLIADARANFARNGLVNITATNAILCNRVKMASSEQAEIDFFVDRAFWASRMNASPDDPCIVKVVKVPVMCLEDEIAAHRANVIVCDIEGAEVELFMDADLTGIRMIIMETHYWSAGEAATDAMIRKLIIGGFNIHPGVSAHERIVLRR